MKMLSRLPLYKRQQLLKEQQAQAQRKAREERKRLKRVESGEPGAHGNDKGKG